jgi:hypothetical protein
MFPVPDGKDPPPRIIGSPWRCNRCHVGETGLGNFACWVCGQRDQMVPGHLYRNPSSAAYIRHQEPTDDQSA